MNFKELYTRVVETTGLEVITPESLCVAVSNCYADMTSRGYREFREKVYTKKDIQVVADGFIKIKRPTSTRRILYLKLDAGEELKNVARMYLTNSAIASKREKTDGTIRTDFSNLNAKYIFYVKDRDITIEWKPQNKLEAESVTLGYYIKLEAPPILKDADDFAKLELDIREEFSDAVVLYCCYFYYSRFLNDIERTMMAQNNYKYYMEDILHELEGEDMYQEEDAVIAMDW